MSLNYFNIEKFEELKTIYGEKPEKLLVCMPTDNADDFFDEGYAVWGAPKTPGAKGSKVRSCDRTRCIHRIAKTIAGHEYGAGEVSECVCDLYDLWNKDNKDKGRPCQYGMYLRAYVLNLGGKVERTLAYLFETHSPNSGNNVKQAIIDMLMFTRFLTGGVPKIALIPFDLSVRMVDSRTDAKQKFPIWQMSCGATIEELRERLLKVAKVLDWDGEVVKQLEQSDSMVQVGAHFAQGEEVAVAPKGRATELFLNEEPPPPEEDLPF